MIHPHLSLDIRILDFLDQQKQTGTPEVMYGDLAYELCIASEVIPGNPDKMKVNTDITNLKITLEQLEREQLITFINTDLYAITERGKKKLDDIRINPI